MLPPEGTVRQTLDQPLWMFIYPGGSENLQNPAAVLRWGITCQWALGDSFRFGRVVWSSGTPGALTENWSSPALWLVVRALDLCMGLKQVSLLPKTKRCGKSTRPSPSACRWHQSQLVSPVPSCNVKTAWEDLGLALLEACVYFRIIQRFLTQWIGGKRKIPEIERNYGSWNYYLLIQQPLMLLL